MFRKMLYAPLAFAALAAPLGTAALADVLRPDTRTNVIVLTPPQGSAIPLVYREGVNPAHGHIVCNRAPCPFNDRTGGQQLRPYDRYVEQRLWALQEELSLLHGMLRTLASQLNELKQQQAESGAATPSGSVPEGDIPEGSVRCGFDLISSEGAQTFLATVVAGQSGWTGQYALSVLVDAPEPVTISADDTLMLEADETRDLASVTLADARSLIASLTLRSDEETVTCQRNETLGHDGAAHPTGEAVTG